MKLSRLLRPLHPAATLLAAAALSLIVAGCAGTPSASTPVRSAPTVAAVAAVTAMPSSVRTARLPAGFPPQVPVPAGDVVQASGAEGASGRGVWTYTVDVAADANVLGRWYAQTLAALNWESTPGTPATPSTPGQVEYRKGDGAQIRLTITAMDSSNSRVDASVSIGVPVTPTQ